MTKRLSVVISGAVSLGSYEAGVMYELLEAIALSNERLREVDPDRYPQERVVIDVITGASAGAMTAGILAQQLMFHGQALRQPYTNPLYEAWVKKINIDELLSVDERLHKYSLLSTEVIDGIAAEYLQERPGPEPDPHPVVDATLRVGVAMANLNGYPLNIKGQSETFSYSRYKDQFVCSIVREASPEGTEVVRLQELEPQQSGAGTAWMPISPPSGSDGPSDDKDASEGWNQLRTMALSSGAFPFAFRSREIARVGGSPSSFMHTRDSKSKKARGDSRRDGAYLYTDGGVFENEPVGMAAELSSQIDRERTLKKRMYLFVAPGKRTFDQDPLLNRDDDLLALATALIAAIFGQSRYQDWITKGLEGELLTVTTSDVALIGDGFSAFGGFLEYDFRAYDYNIGRRTARQKLVEGRFRDLIGDFEAIRAQMKCIDWLDENDSGKEGTSLAAMPAAATNAFGETDRWLAKCAELKSLAEGGKSSSGSRQNSQGSLQQLRLLMANVSDDRRAVISKQIRNRVNSLIDYVNADYLDPADQKRIGGEVLKLVRRRIGKPLTKLLVYLIWVRPFLRRNILKPEGS